MCTTKSPKKDFHEKATVHVSRLSLRHDPCDSVHDPRVVSFALAAVLRTRADLPFQDIGWRSQRLAELAGRCKVRWCGGWK